MSLIIGNTMFTSSTQYNISSSNMSSLYMPLRGDPVTLPSGKSITSFSLTIDFATPYHISTELIPLIAMFRTSPIVNINYEPLQAKMGFSKLMLCGLKALEVTTVPGTVGFVRANVELVWCNWDGLSKAASVDNVTLESFIAQANSKLSIEYPQEADGNLSLSHKFIGDFSLSEDDSSLVLAAVKFTLLNNFATVPILGQVYPRIQHVGGTVMGGSLVFQSPGPDHTKLAELSAFVEGTSRILLNKNYLGNTSEGRLKLMQVTASNYLLNMCGLKSIILSSNSSNEIPETLCGTEYTITFYDAQNTNKYDGPKLVFRKSNKQMSSSTNEIFKKFENDSVYRDAVKREYPDTWDILNDYLVEELSTYPELPGLSANEGMLTDAWTSPSLKTYEGLSDVNATRATSDLLNDRAFLESEFGKDLKSAQENMYSQPTYRSYNDLSLEVTQNPYDIFSEAHEIDYAGVNAQNKDREEIYKFADTRGETNNIVQGKRPGIEALVEADLRDFVAYDMLTNRFAELYPVVKLYIIETDNPYDSRFADDLYEVETVDNIMLIQSKELPAATLSCSIYNIWNQYAASDTDINKALKESETGESVPPKLQGSEIENKITKVPIAPGVRVQLRYGFVNDASTLKTIFNGTIREVEVDNNNTIVITASDAGEELTNSIGETPQLIRSHLNSSGSVTLHTTDALDKPFLESLTKTVFEKGATRADTLAFFYLIKSQSPDFVYPPVSMWFSRLRYMCKNFFKTKTATLFNPPTLATWDVSPIIRDHLKRNITMPPYIPWLKGFETPPDIIGMVYNTTPWTMLNELVDLYPGTCVTTRPYENETTVFVGDADSDLIVTSNAAEASLIDTPNRNKLVNGMKEVLGGSYGKFIGETLADFIKTHPNIPVSEQKSIYRTIITTFQIAINENSKSGDTPLNDIPAYDGFLDLPTLVSARRFRPGSMFYKESYAHIYNQFQKVLMKKSVDMIKNKYELSGKESSSMPGIEIFRRTHYADSSYNLIFNNIKENDSVYNAVAVNWMSASTVGGEPVFDPENEVIVHIPGIEPKDLKVEHYQPNNIFNKDMATKLGTSLLCKEFAHAYDGEIGLTSQRHIRPYDYIYLNDRVNMLYGPVEVRDSILYANKENGVMYIVVPDLIVKHSTIPINEYAAGYLFAPMYKYEGEINRMLSASPLGIIPFSLYNTAKVAVKGLVGAYRFAFEDNLQIVTAPLVKINSEGEATPYLNQQKYFGKEGLWQDTKDYVKRSFKGLDTFSKDVLNGLVVAVG